MLLVVGRFLALLELYREQVVTFEQLAPLGDLTIRWTGDDESDVSVTDEFDVEREIDRAVVSVVEADPESEAQPSSTESGQREESADE